MTDRDRGAYNGFEDLQREEEELTRQLEEKRGEKPDPIMEALNKRLEEQKKEAEALEEAERGYIEEFDFNGKKLVMDRDCHIKIVSVKQTGNGLAYNEEKVARCIIEEGEIIDNVETHKTYARLCLRYRIGGVEKTAWISTDFNNVFTTLKDKGFILKKGEKGEQAITTLIDELHEAGRIKSREGHHNIGFYLIHGEDGPRVVSEYIKEINSAIGYEKDIEEAIKTLNSFISMLSPEQQRIAVYMFLHQLTAPFDYIRKTLNYGRVTLLYLHGESHTGKTLIANATTYLYYPNKQFFEIENQTHEKFRIRNGQEASTVAQLEHVLKSTTLPIIIDEAETIIDNTNLLEMLRRAINSTTARVLIKRHRTGKETPRARSTPILISNKASDGLRSHKGEARRFRVIKFDDTMRIDRKAVEEFNSKWMVSDTGQFNPQTPLKKLWIIGAIASDMVSKNIDLLLKPRLEAGREILERIYGIVGWDFKHSIFNRIEPYKPATIEELKKDEIEMSIDLLKKEISDSWKDTEIEDADVGRWESALTLEDKAIKLGKTGKIPWFIYNPNKREYALSKGFLDLLSERHGIERTLEGYAKELSVYLGDERVRYGVAWFSNLGNSKKAVKIPQKTLHGLLAPPKEDGKSGAQPDFKEADL